MRTLPILIIVWINSLAFSQQANFTFLEGLDHNQSTVPFAVSRDGSAICGASMIDQGYIACKWENNQVISMGYLPNDYPGSVAYGLSSDGSIVVGSSQSYFSRFPFSWNLNDGIVSLGLYGQADLPYGFASGVSLNPTKIVGQSSGDERYIAFLWSESNGMVDLGDIGNSGLTFAYNISKDGSVIVGASSENGSYQPVKWINDQPNPIRLEVLNQPLTEGAAYYVSSDNSTIVGYSGRNPKLACKWVNNHIISLENSLTNHTESMAFGCSQDGSKIIGYYIENNIYHAFIYDSSGMHNLQEYLQSKYCVNLGGISLLEARGISDDGKCITGMSQNLLNISKGWVIRFNISGDVDNNGMVDYRDLIIFLSSYGLCQNQQGFNPNCDFDCNNCVDVRDLSVFLQAYGISH